MKQQTLLLALLAILFSSPVYALKIIGYEKDKEPLPITFYGFVKHEPFWDSRQVVGSADDESLKFPEPKKLDPNCRDINSKGQFDMVDIATRINVEFDGPEIKHAKIDAKIAVDFVGKSPVINLVRMRQAWATLTWSKTVFLFGQAYIPMTVQKCRAKQIGRNDGRPIESYARQPQLKLTYKPTESFHMIFAALSQLDFLSDGPIGTSSTYVRDAVVPMLQARFDFYVGEHVFGFGGGFKRLVPRLETDTGAKAHERLNSGEAIAYLSLNWETFQLRNKFLFAQNGSDMAMIGGYAVSFVDPVNDNRDYTNINAVGWWLDCDVTKHPTFTPGMFLGIIKNLGARECILQNVVDSEGVITDRRIYGLGTDIDTVFRFAPRFRWKTGKFEFGAEVEYTRAAYGTITDCGDVVDTDPVGNTRLMVAIAYHF